MFSSSAFALSDTEYLQMKKDSPEYSRAEQKLKNSMPQNAYDYLLDEQREWIRNGRDEIAKELENININNKNSAARKFLGVQ